MTNDTDMSSILNTYDKTLHDEIHKEMMNSNPDELLSNSRLQVLDMIKNYEIRGVIADIGCGSGYFGIAVAQKFKKVERVDCIEASSFAVENLIPKNIIYWGQSSKVHAIHGSFDNLPKNYYDIVFAMGALHHSRNLKKTLTSIHQALKPNGLLIAQEPAMPDTTTHLDYNFKYSITEERFGIKIKNGDRYDRFFRECEYKSTLVNSGFDINFWGNFKAKDEVISIFTRIKNNIIANGILKTLMKIVSKILSFNNTDAKNISGDLEWKNQMNKATKGLESKLMIAKKSNSDVIYHNNS